MELDITNLLSSDKAELSGRAQNGNDPTASSNTPKVKRSLFKELERGPAKDLPKLSNDFDLEQAMASAYKKALVFANDVLTDDQMNMSLEKSNEGNHSIIVKDITKDEVVQEYDPLKILQMYSSNYNLQGVIVDAII